MQQPALRGAEVFAKQLSKALRARGHATKTVYLYSATDSGLPLGPGDVVLDASRAHPLERLLVQPGVVSKLKSLLTSFRPNVVQLNGGRAVKYGAALRHVDRRGPWVGIYRNIGDPEHWVRGRAKRFAYRVGVFSGVDGIVALSDGAAASFRNVFGVDAPIEVIPTGMSPEDLVPSLDRSEVRRAADTPMGAPVALYVGSFSPEKRLDRLVDAFARASRDVPDAHLWLVGDGPARPELERRVRDLGLAPRTSFVGSTPDVASYYAAADVFALTSDTEGIPGVLLEAAYFALPVVATDVGLVRECVLDEHSALLARPTDASVGDALTRLLRDPELRSRLGRRGRLLVEERFLMSDIAARYESFYRRVLSRRGRAGEP